MVSEQLSESLWRCRMTAWLFLWLWWFINSCISAAFVVTGLITFRNIKVVMSCQRSPC